MSTALPEFQHYPEGTIPKAMFDKATREIAHYLVSFSVDDRPSGSASLVTVDGRYGLLTAAHVVDHLFQSPSKAIAVICCERLHRLLIDKNHLAITRIGPTDGPMPGPDLAFVEILDLTALGTLRAIKSFYPFTNPIAPNWESLKPKSATVCFIAGAPAEQSSETGTRMTESHILFTTHFFGRAQLSQTFERDDFDYLVFDCIAGAHDFPVSFGGISGGGVWHVPFAMDPTKGPSTLTILRSELIGVAFWQSKLLENMRQITAHDYLSAYRELHRKLLHI